MKSVNIIKQLDWADIFENSSQTENLYDFLLGHIDLNEFTEGFYPRSKNKKIIKNLVKNNVSTFKKHAKKLWNISNVYVFSEGDEEQNRKKYINKL